MQRSLPQPALHAVHAVRRGALALVPALALAACGTDSVTRPTEPAARGVEMTGTGDPRAAAAALPGAALYVNPSSPAQRQADIWRSSRPADAAQMDKIASQPVAVWLGEWSGDVRAAVSSAVSRAAGRMTVFVAYNIPSRDCGGHSAGGIAAGAYRTWVRGIAAGLGSGPAVIVLEPDALAGMDCLGSAAQNERVSLISDAVDVLKAAGAAVYIDAGNARWHPADVMASRLARAALARADGFAINVSNFIATDITTAYGEAISQRTGGKHFVIDVSRNGLGGAADGQWCNPSGRALGVNPTTVTANALIDAYLWVKVPGESDGTCNGGPPAGAWWPEYALGLAQRRPTSGETPPPNRAPVASVGGPYAASEGAAVTLSGAASVDPDGDALTYAWSFGDGTTGAGVTVAKTYPNSGTFTVTLSVTDPAGATTQAATTINVADVPPTATFISPIALRAGAAFSLSLINATDPSPEDRGAGFTYQFDCGQGWFGPWTAASSVTCEAPRGMGTRIVRARVREMWGYGRREYRAAVWLTR